MTRKYLLRSTPRWVRYRWALLFSGVALTLAIGFHLADRDDPDRTRRPATVPVEKEETSNAFPVDREQSPEVATSSRGHHPSRPVVEEVRRSGTAGGHPVMPAETGK
ncbi:hypothetical protein GCM10010517_61150 [Streptosporangium fragile]|uniref:Secreted protein n=1 Tax=Streptosporangium fragile TaxID=46186 RepID=A0ABN3W6E3_9ACTN